MFLKYSSESGPPRSWDILAASWWNTLCFHLLASILGDRLVFTSTLSPISTTIDRDERVRGRTRMGTGVGGSNDILHRLRSVNNLSEEASNDVC